jgi:hypothetical protein
MDRKAKWNQIATIFQYDPLLGYRYKSCSGCIIELRYPTKEEYSEFCANEDREAIVDHRLAKYRANAMFVLRIWDVTKGTWIDEISHTWTGPWHTVWYRVGNLVFPNTYDPNENEVCAPGIHYFHSLQPAFFWCLGLQWIEEDGSVCSMYHSAFRDCDMFHLMFAPCCVEKKCSLIFK